MTEEAALKALIERLEDRAMIAQTELDSAKMELHRKRDNGLLH
jgi:hypothetical protein